MIIMPENLVACADKLYVYDVLQKGWEQEPNGAHANAMHVLTHLTKDLVRKDFGDKQTVQEEIVPDAIQYAIRLARWSNSDVEDLVPKVNGPEGVAIHAAKQLGGMITSAAAWAEAAGYLASNLHDIDHANKRESAVTRQAGSMIAAGQMLITCAELASEQYSVNSIEAFDSRLSQLRERFGIPQPD